MPAIPSVATGRSIPKGELLAALARNRGKVARAARELQCSRAYIHDWIKADASFAAAVSSYRTVRPAEVAKILQSFVVDEDAVAVRALSHKESRRASVMAVIVETLMAQLRVSRREVVEALAHPQHRKRIEDLLPPAVSADAKPKQSLQVSIRHDQRAWLSRKPRGTAPSILAAVDWTDPRVVLHEKETPSQLYHTSWFLPVEVADAVVTYAQDTGRSIGAVVRAALDNAIADEAPTSAAA